MRQVGWKEKERSTEIKRRTSTGQRGSTLQEQPCRSQQVLAANRLARFFAALHVELLIDAPYVRFHGVTGDHQHFSDLRVGETSHQQMEDPLLLRAQWLDEPDSNGQPRRREGDPLKLLLGKGTEQCPRIRRREALPAGGQDSAQQGGYLLSFVQEEALVALGVGKQQRFSKQGRGLSVIILSDMRKGHEKKRLHLASRPPMLMRLCPPAFEQAKRLVSFSFRNAQTCQHELLLLLLQLTRRRRTSCWHDFALR